MSRELAYVDSSALVKLFKTEDESDAISAALTEWPVGQPELRTLDAIHLATAESMGDRLGVVFTYDDRLISAALLEGLPVASPKRK